jgi:membrane-associated phospholipid phosphatase
VQRRQIIAVLVLGGAIVVAHLFDPLAFRLLRIEDIYGEDWGRMLRVMGFLPLWLAAAVALALHERTPWRRVHRSRAGFLVAGATLGGIVAELAKLVFRRRRPGEFGEYLFRPFADRPLSTGGLGLPSSHALVAFGAAAILARIFPRARIVWWGLAWGCALSRVAAGAHFLSDVVVAAVLGWLVGAFLWRHAPATIRPVAATPPPAAPAQAPHRA